jgi:hypothetical protein
MTEATYDVVLLIEQPLSRQDAEQVRGLHSDVSGPVRYHVLLPVEDAAARVESAMGSIAASEVLASPALAMDRENVEAVQRELLEEAREECDSCVERLRHVGADVSGEVVSADPIDALAAKVQLVDAAEAIILTRSHVVAEFFHLDWTSRARRKLGVPVLHLLEHENFDEQAGGGEGVSGM